MRLLLLGYLLVLSSVSADHQRDLHEQRRKARALTQEEVEATIFRRHFDLPPERDVTSPTVPTPATVVPGGPIASPSVSAAPSPQGGNPTNLPPIPVFPTSTPPPTLGPGQSFEPSLSGFPSRAPSDVESSAPSNGALLPSMPAPMQPATPTSNAAAIAAFLETTLTDDGTLSTRGTPQFLAYIRLIATNPELNPAIEEDQIEIMQRYSLNVLFFATDGLTWQMQDGWTTALDLCEGTNWFGVTCNTNDEVIQVDLSNNGLFGVLPSEIRGLTKLQTFDLSSNLLLSVIPTDIGEMTFLEILNLGSNNLGTDQNLVPVVGAIPDSLANLVNLRSINLSLNFFGGTLPFGLFMQMPRLSFIDFLFNDFTGSIPASIGRLTSLAYLDLSHNALRGTLPTELGILTALTDLRVAKTDLSDVPDGLCEPNCINGAIPTQMGNLVNLQRLWLFENGIGDSFPSELGRLWNLQTLVIFRNNLSGNLPPEISGLVGLGLFDFSENFIGPELTQELVELPSLVRLNIEINSFRTLLPESYTLPSIQRMSIGRNFFAGTIPTQLATLTTLTSLTVRATALTGDVPTEFGLLTALDFLNLSLNFLSGSLPSELGLLADLTALQIEITNSVGSIPAELASLQNLVELALSQNRLSSTIPSELGLMGNLVGLELFNNTLTGSIPTELSGMTNLVDMELRINSLEGNVPSSLGLINSLVTLTLESNLFSGSVPNKVCGLSLTTLTSDCAGQTPLITCACCTQCF